MTTPTFTELEGDRKFKQIEWLAAVMPHCDIAYLSPAEGECTDSGDFDSPTGAGPWGNFCAEHVVLVCPPNTSIGFHRIPKET